MGGGASPLNVGSRAVGGEPYQRAFHIVKQTDPGTGDHTPTCDEHIVETGLGDFWDDASRRLAHPPLGAITLDRAANALGRGEADADQGQIIAARPRLDDEGTASARRRLGAGEKFAALTEACNRKIGVRHGHPGPVRS